MSGGLLGLNPKKFEKQGLNASKKLTADRFLEGVERNRLKRFKGSSDSILLILPQVIDDFSPIKDFDN
jgi:hypothetical protein